MDPKAAYVVTKSPTEPVRREAREATAACFRGKLLTRRGIGLGWRLDGGRAEVGRRRPPIAKTPQVKYEAYGTLR